MATFINRITPTNSRLKFSHKRRRRPIHWKAFVLRHTCTCKWQ